MDQSCCLCGKAARREEKVEARSLYVIDCENCGVYQVGGTSRARLRTLRDERDISSTIKRIGAANAKGYVFCYPDGTLIAGHPWLSARVDPAQYPGAGA